ncbi:MAG: hypothetical protein KC983_10795 [Phycisphaerales bacterium]|nr:hypothetical protein [Phycisphaerales bacterium]
MTVIIVILLQCVLGVAMYVGFRRLVRPNLIDVVFTRLALDVWCPVALAMPMIGLACRVTGSVEGPGHAALSTPVLIAIGAGSLTMWTGALSHQVWRLNGALFGVAGFLLLLGAAHDLNLWSGQASFAIGAVVLWMVTPGATDLATSDAASDSARASIGLLIMMVAGVGQAVVAWFAPPVVYSFAWIVPLLTGVAACGSLRGVTSVRNIVRLGSGVGMYGVLFGIGAMAMSAMVRRLAGDATAAVDGTAMAFGFGVLAPEASALLCAALLLVLVGESEGRARRWAGVGGFVVAGVLTARLGVVMWRWEKNQEATAEVSILETQADASSSWAMAGPGPAAGAVRCTVWLKAERP